MAGKHNMTIYQGTTFRRKMTYEKADEPLPLFDCTFSLDVTPTSGPQLRYTSETGHFVIDNPATGQFTLTIPADETMKFIWQSARYNLEIHYANGDVFRMLEGNLRVNRRA